MAKIYVLRTNPDLIEGKGPDIIIGVSTNIKKLIELAEKRCLTPMGGKSFYAVIVAYDNVASFDREQFDAFGDVIFDKYGVHSAPYKTVQYHCPQRNKWFNPESSQ